MNLIDRDKLVKSLVGMYSFPRRIKDFSSFDEVVDEVIRFVESQPKISLENKTSDWIPCSERLPKENGWYLVTSKSSWSDEVKVYMQLYQNGWRTYAEVIAWQSLPKPYEG